MTANDRTDGRWGLVGALLVGAAVPTALWLLLDSGHHGSALRLFVTVFLAELTGAALALNWRERAALPQALAAAAVNRCEHEDCRAPALVEVYVTGTEEHLLYLCADHQPRFGEHGRG